MKETPEDRLRRQRREWYYRNREREVIKTTGRTKEKRKAIRLFLENLKKESGCVRCGEREVVCLDFHHVLGNKEFNLGFAAHGGYSLERVKQEVAKCVILCCNCHRKEHKSGV